MKKSIKFLLCSLLIIPCLFAITACKEPEEQPKPIMVTTEAELQTALNNAESDTVVKLQNDITISTTLNVAQKVTLDLNGKTINNTIDIYNQDENDYAMIAIKQNGNLTVTGEGKIIAKLDDCWVFDVDGGKLTILNGEFVGNVDVVYVTTGEAHIKGGKYSVQQSNTATDGQEKYVLNCEDANRYVTAKIYVYGGEFVKFNPGDCWAEGEHTNFLAEGYKSTLIPDTTNNYKVEADA